MYFLCFKKVVDNKGGSSQKANTQGSNINDGFYPIDEDDELPF